MKSRNIYIYIYNIYRPWKREIPGEIPEPETTKQEEDERAMQINISNNFNSNSININIINKNEMGRTPALSSTNSHEKFSENPLTSSPKYLASSTSLSKLPAAHKGVGEDIANSARSNRYIYIYIYI